MLYIDYICAEHTQKDSGGRVGVVLTGRVPHLKLKRNNDIFPLLSLQKDVVIVERGWLI